MYFNMVWAKSGSELLYNIKNKNKKLQFKKIRFFFPTTAYIVNLHSNIIVFNLFYKTSLENFQNNNMSNKGQTPYINFIETQNININKAFYIV